MTIDRTEIMRLFDLLDSDVKDEAQKIKIRLKKNLGYLLYNLPDETKALFNSVQAFKKIFCPHTWIYERKGIT